MFVVLGLGNSPDIFYKVHYIRVGGFSPYPTPLTRKENYMDKEKTQETDAEKIARIEKALVDKDSEIANLKAEKETLEKKVNSLKIDGLVKKVEPTKVEEEDIQFDFDL